jgi:hypothetical protein
VGEERPSAQRERRRYAGRVSETTAHCILLVLAAASLALLGYAVFLLTCWSMMILRVVMEYAAGEVSSRAVKRRDDVRATVASILRAPRAT